MTQRIIEIRKKKGLSQEQFAQKLNLSRSFVNQIEVGKRNISDRTIADICRVFDVNETWLRTGKGEMFHTDDEALINKIAEKYHLSDIDKEVFKLYIGLSEHDRQVLTSFSYSLAGKILENPVLYREFKRARGELPKLSQADIDVEVAAYRDGLELLAKAQSTETTPTTETPVVQDDIEALVQKAAGITRRQGILEKKQESLASSAKESGAG